MNDEFILYADISLAFQCKVCGDVMSEDNVEGKCPDAIWARSLANKAGAEGWVVLNAWEAVCPKCAKTQAGIDLIAASAKQLPK